MAAKKKAAPVVESKPGRKMGRVKIPKSVGVIGMRDKVWRKLMIKAIKEAVSHKARMKLPKDVE